MNVSPRFGILSYNNPQQPYYPHVTPTSQPRQSSPKQDYPSPTPSQFHNVNNNNNNNNNITSNNNMSQPRQSSPSTSQSSTNQSQQQRYTQFPSQQRRNNNNNNNSNNNNNNNTNNNNNNNNVQGVKKCESCHTSSSPEWRRGPTGHKTLCNACGLRYSRTIARENRKREQAQREQEQRQREQREREERARERAAATVMMQRVIEPFSQYRSSNTTPIPIMTPGQQHHHHHQTSANSSHSTGPLQYHPSTLPPISYRHQPQPSHHHHNIRPIPLSHHHQIDLPPPLNNDRIGYTLPPPHYFDRQQNGAGGASNSTSYQIPGGR
ncbi:hypothetical protein RclHR1_03330003 [Rhizophagus clarus]|uniref:GATA-type domain-containing protein n=1 Tax=Rhizophagus clarus TaxID=94130 RepID=A0A2Z6S3C4_9GLOM|nr:hypothetical protein RclHR1_03330003 [Rhizophagus clarus]